METKSPTTSVKSREIIGVDQFTQRREVFDKYDTVFVPLQSPTNIIPVYKEVEPIVTSNQGKTTTNFKRNAATYSSMREPRENYNLEFRPRKYSDNFTSESNQNDEVDYRRSMTERTRRLSKLRRDFLNSNLHEPGKDSPFARTGMRASMPATSATAMKYKIESPNLYKFPFAEPYATPPPVRRVVVDLGPPEVNGDKENQKPEPKPKHVSLPSEDSLPKVDHQKLFEELVKRYSPQRKPVDWKLPPTRARVVGSIPKSTSSMGDTVDNADKKILDDSSDKVGEYDDVFGTKEVQTEVIMGNAQNEEKIQDKKEESPLDVKQNGPDNIDIVINKKEVSESTAESDEKNDQVPELSPPQKQNILSNKRPSLDKYTDLTIPALLEKMTEEAEELESHKKDKKVKRKRSFLDKLLGRKKDKQKGTF